MHKPPFKPVPILPITDAPGYLESVAQEQSVRDSAFLRLNETIAGFEVRPLLYRQYLFLRFIRSPILVRQTPEQLDLARFLWMLSPQFSANRWFRRWLFMSRCNRDFIGENKLERAREVIGAAMKFIDEQLMDLPKGSREFEKDFYSDTCSVISFFWREFGMREAEVMELPMSILIQKMREAQHHLMGNKAGLRNRSDDISDAWLELHDRNIKKARAN